MSLHIEFCLDEIDCEIEAALDNALDDIDRISLQRHVAGMRAIIAFARMRSAAHHTVPVIAEEDLTLVKGIGLAEQKILNGVGVRTFAAIANWRFDDITVLAQHGISLERIACENWIEQAAMVASGSTTHYALLARDASASLVEQRLHNDTAGAVDDQAETLSQKQTEDEAEASTTTLALDQACESERVPSTEIIETPQITAAIEHVPDEPVNVAPLPTAAVIPFEPALKSPRQSSARPLRRVAVVAAASILTILGVGFVAYHQLGDSPSMIVSYLRPSIK